mgnify:CR=1 FL=1
MQNLPVRGQRTKNNSRTRKGKAKPIAGERDLLPTARLELGGNYSIRWLLSQKRLVSSKRGW